LAHRDIHDLSIAATLINICKTANDEEDFIAKAAQHNINISKNFLDSLYGTIKQKLPHHRHEPELPLPPARQAVVQERV
jgi:malate synthase